MLALLVGAALMAMLFDILGADALQSRKLVAHNQKTADVLRAHREFLAAATAAHGQASAGQAGELSITSRGLELAGRADQPLLGWSQGRGRLDYSTDGRTWRAETADAARDMIRFTWQQGGQDAQQDLVWIAP